jgi:hypothetical protein
MRLAVSGARGTRLEHAASIGSSSGLSLSPRAGAVSFWNYLGFGLPAVKQTAPARGWQRQGRLRKRASVR